MSATRPVLVGNRSYLRALRAAEMAAWEAGMLLNREIIPGLQGTGGCDGR